jgi:RNA polymerase sigma factor (sigma-70 family)
VIRALLEDILSSPAKTETELSEDTFANFYEMYVDSMFNFCVFQLRDSARAEELTADIFEKAWRARRRFEPERASFATWLFSIARRVIIDEQRRRARRPVVPLSNPQIDVKQPSPEVELERSEQLQKLNSLLHDLSVSEQDLIALKFGAGMNNKQIAQLLNKSESAIGTSLHRCLGKIRTGWKEQEERRHD